MSKKILSIVLALALAVSCFAVSAFALGAMGYEELIDKDLGAVEGNIVGDYAQAWDLSEPVDNGDGIWTVDVILTANYGVGAIQFTVNNTNNAGVVLSAVAAKNIPADWEANVGFKNSTGKVIINANPTTDSVTPIDCTGGKAIATLTYTVAADATAKINIVKDPKNAANPGGTLIAARPDDGNVVTGTAMVGQAVTSTGSTRNIGAAAAPVELVINDSNVSNITTMTYGGAYAGTLVGFAGTAFNTKNYLTSALSASNGGSLNFVQSTLMTGGRNKYGTGATVQLIDTDGTTVLATYVILIFGDTNGDGLINTSDMTKIANHLGNTELMETNSLAYYAATGGDGSSRGINLVAGDRTGVRNHFGNTKLLVQSTVKSKYLTVSC